MIILSISASSNTGLRREHNEDMALVSRQLIRDTSLCTKVMLADHNRYVVAVADGIGGCNAGERASEEAMRSLSHTFNEAPWLMNPQEFILYFDRWLRLTNNDLVRLGRQHRELHGLGTTVVALMFYEGRTFWANCGDSRLYRFRNGLLTQLTSDHSLDRVTGNPADSHVLTNSLGDANAIPYFDQKDITTCMQDGDIYLLCSDGLTDMVSDEQIERILSTTPDAESLIKAACDGGGRDNVTVCLVRIQLN